MLAASSVLLHQLIAPHVDLLFICKLAALAQPYSFVVPPAQDTITRM